MSRAKLKIRYTRIEPQCTPDTVMYAVELHLGSRCATVGRICGSGHDGRRQWIGLRVCGYHWTPWRTTRTNALNDMLGYCDTEAEQMGAYGLGEPYREPAYASERLRLRDAVEILLGVRPSYTVPTTEETQS